MKSLKSRNKTATLSMASDTKYANFGGDYKGIPLQDMVKMYRTKNGVNNFGISGYKIPTENNFNRSKK